MFRFKMIFGIFILLGAWVVSAEPTNAGVTANPPAPEWSLSLTLLSWQERVSLQNGNNNDLATADFYGGGLQFTRSQYFGESTVHGALLEAELLSGATTVGGTQTQLTYQTANISWWGASVSYLYDYHLSDQVTLLIGPELLDRQITYANIGGTSATSGASLNYGLVGEMREKLTERFQAYQKLGTLFVNASTLWSFGLGYGF